MFRRGIDQIVNLAQYIYVYHLTLEESWERVIYVVIVIPLPYLEMILGLISLLEKIELNIYSCSSCISDFILLFR
jgi:hypothetical protein